MRESSLFLSLLILLGKASRLLSMIATHSDVGSVGGIADRNEISAAERANTRPLARPRPRPELRETGLYHTNRCITLLLPSDRDRGGRATRVCASYLRGGGGGAVGGIRPAAAAAQ